MIQAHHDVAPAARGMAERRMEAAAKCLYLRLAERGELATQEAAKRVTFTNFKGLPKSYDGFRAELGGVAGHPRLGVVPWVTTSAVRQINYDGERVVMIITRNTTYGLAVVDESCE